MIICTEKYEYYITLYKILMKARSYYKTLKLNLGFLKYNSAKTNLNNLALGGYPPLAIIILT